MRKGIAKEIAYFFESSSPLHTASYSDLRNFLCSVEFLADSSVDYNTPALENAAHSNLRHQSKTKTKPFLYQISHLYNGRSRCVWLEDLDNLVWWEELWLRSILTHSPKSPCILRAFLTPLMQPGSLSLPRPSSFSLTHTYTVTCRKIHAYAVYVSIMPEPPFE